MTNIVVGFYYLIRKNNYYNMKIFYTIKIEFLKNSFKKKKILFIYKKK